MTGERLNDFKSTYQNSDEEKRDVLSAYKSSKGKLNSVFNKVMLSNPLDDEDRFREYIDQAIKEGDVEAFDAYVHEPKGARTKRLKRAKKESEDAQEHAKKIGVYSSLFGEKDTRKAGKKKKADAAEPDLVALMQQRAKGRTSTFLENLEAKYADSGKKTKKNKSKETEPSEEAFQQTAARMKKRKAPPVVEDYGDNEDDETEDIDLKEGSTAPEPAPQTTKPKKSTRPKRVKR